VLTYSKILGIVIAAFVAGSFVASPELRAYAANTIGSSDIINESILSEDIKNSQVKAADIATDAVGAAEIAGVSKLLFGQCSTSEAGGASYGPGVTTTVRCAISGADTDDSVMATLNANVLCFGVEQAYVQSSGNVQVHVKNDCSVIYTWPSGVTIAIIVYDK
jgi:hypothetical protein